MFIYILLLPVLIDKTSSSDPVIHWPSCFKSIFKVKANSKLKQTNKNRITTHKPLVSLSGSQDSEQEHFVSRNKKILELALSPQLVKNSLRIKKKITKQNQHTSSCKEKIVPCPKSFASFPQEILEKKSFPITLLSCFWSSHHRAPLISSVYFTLFLPTIPTSFAFLLLQNPMKTASWAWMCCEHSMNCL